MPRDGTKLALFIDGINTHAAARALGFDIDYKRLLTEFQSRGTLVRAFYYTVIVEDQEFSALRPLIDWLDYNGFTVVTKPAKEFDDGEGRRKLKRNISVELAIDAGGKILRRGGARKAVKRPCHLPAHRTSLRSRLRFPQSTPIQHRPSLCELQVRLSAFRMP